MGQQPWKTYRSSAAEKPLLGDDRRPVVSASAESRQQRLERLKAEIASGAYSVSAESLATRLARRIRWW